MTDFEKIRASGNIVAAESLRVTTEHIKDLQDRFSEMYAEFARSFEEAELRDCARINDHLRALLDDHVAKYEALAADLEKVREENEMLRERLLTRGGDGRRR